jgi:hypothetical protein
VTSVPEPSRSPPPGVPRWLWPPPGAVVRRVVLREEAHSGAVRHSVVEGEPPGERHLRALQWIVGEHPREEDPPSVPGVVDVLLEIARSEMKGGRVGHAYALGGRAMGDPKNASARGVLWRYAKAVLGAAPEEFDHWEEDLFA